METDVELQGTATGFQDYYFFFFFYNSDTSFIISKQPGKVVLFEAQIWSEPGPSLSYKFFKVSQEVSLATSKTLPGKDAIRRRVNSAFFTALAARRWWVCFPSCWWVAECVPPSFPAQALCRGKGLLATGLLVLCNFHCSKSICWVKPTPAFVWGLRSL